MIKRIFPLVPFFLLGGWLEAQVVCASTPQINISGATFNGTSTSLIGTTEACSVGASQTAGSVCNMSNSILAEGTTADNFETTIAFGDATADASLTLTGVATGVDATGFGIVSVAGATTCPDTANAVCLGANTIVSEGATANGFENSIAFGDATADGTLTMTGTATGVNLQVTAPANTELRVTQTLPAAPAAQVQAFNVQATSAGAAAQPQVALQASLLAGYTGASFSVGGMFTNTALSSTANYGAFGSATGTTGTLRNIGMYGQGGSGGAGVTGVGAQGLGNGGAKAIGGNFIVNPVAATANIGLMTTLSLTETATTTSAAFIADNAAVAAPIFIARDNGTAVFTIADGGATSMTGTLIGDLRSVETVATTKSPAVTETTEIYTNGADVDGQAITLTNDPTVGTCFEFALTSTDTSNSFSIAPSAGETLQDAGVSCATAFTATAKGATARICAVSGGSGALWLVMSKNGTWTCS